MLLRAFVTEVGNSNALARHAALTALDNLEQEYADLSFAHDLQVGEIDRLTNRLFELEPPQ